ncbi:hypothetical protein E6W39_20430 [Kitasatospora acidiphila]|uniref:Uncharacterized protein n=1 Tax=Kitasatospora acidiphila TaxID=2567942 RepID=A0A540W757_9ACTN|nr:hypothetical protein E6W39_20430 [Kitasatospora acidiphila]
MVAVPGVDGTGVGTADPDELGPPVPPGPPDGTAPPTPPVAPPPPVAPDPPVPPPVAPDPPVPPPVAPAPPVPPPVAPAPPDDEPVPVPEGLAVGVPGFPPPVDPEGGEGVREGGSVTTKDPRTVFCPEATVQVPPTGPRTVGAPLAVLGVTCALKFPMVIFPGPGWLSCTGGAVPVAVSIKGPDAGMAVLATDMPMCSARFPCGATTVP